MVDNIIVGIILFVCLTVVNAGETCDYYDTDTDDWWDRDINTMWCEHGCCGSKYDQYCCLDAKTGMIVGIVLGCLALIAIVVSVLVAVFCCCRKSQGRAGQVCQPSGATTAVPMYGVPTTTVGYGQPGYINTTYPQMQTSNVAPGTTQNWQQPPPTYDQINPK